MLDFMRRNANSWVMIFLFGIIIFVFAINFGPWAGNASAGVPYAATVNHEAISMAEFRTAYASQFARIKQFRPEYDQSQADKDGLKQIVVEQLVSRELLTQLGRQKQLTIGARTLAEEIKERVFGGDQEFNKEEYIRRVNAFFQSTVPQFEEQVEKELIAEQMANLLGTGVYVSEEEARMAFKDKNTKVAIEFIKVNPKHFTAVRAITADEIKRYQDANGKQISDYYNEHIGEYVQEKQIRASHILVKVAQNTSPTEKAALKEKAQKIRERVKNNEDFAEVAKKESDDTGSKIKGGDLGFFAPGAMVEEFSKAAFALKPGEVSEIIESPFGFHIIKQTDQKPEQKRKLEEASSEIAELLLRKAELDQKAKQLATLALTELKNGVLLEKIKIPGLTNLKATGGQPTSLFEPVANETDGFNRSAAYIPKIGKASGISDEAFKLTMATRTPADVIEANGEFFAIRLKSREDADMTKYEEQKESIKSALVFPRRRAFIQQYLTNLKASAKISYNDALVSASAHDSDL